MAFVLGPLGCATREATHVESDAESSAASPSRVSRGEAGGPIESSCREISSMFGRASTLTAREHRDAWKSYEGRSFTWRLAVVDVQPHLFGGMTVRFKCAPADGASAPDLEVAYDEDARTAIAMLRPGDEREVSGTLTRASSLIGMWGKAKDD